MIDHAIKAMPRMTLHRSARLDRPAARPAALRAATLADGQVPVLHPPDLLSHLSPEERRTVIRLGQRRRLMTGDSLFRQGEAHRGIFLIESGLVRVYYTAPTGREITLGYWNVGHFAGGPEIFGGGTHVWSGDAAEPTTILAFGARDLEALVRRLPNFAVGIIEGLVFKGKCYSAVCQMLGTRSVADRLAMLLRLLADLHGEPHDGGTMITVPFTHENMAALIGSTRQWVTTTLTRLEAKGALRRDGGRIVLLRRELVDDPAN
jgi:CRP/FNR family transcriptional regulator, cyclic AMP receptor protein